MDLIPLYPRNYIFKLWRTSFKKTCAFPKTTPNYFIYKFTVEPLDLGKYTSYITQNKRMQRNLRLANNSISNQLVEYIISPSLNGKNLLGIPNNTAKIFSFARYIYKEHQVRVNYTHFLSHVEADRNILEEILKPEISMTDTRLAEKEIKIKLLEQKIGRINLKSFGHEGKQIKQIGQQLN